MDISTTFDAVLPLEYVPSVKTADGGHMDGHLKPTEEFWNTDFYASCGTDEYDFTIGFHFRVVTFGHNKVTAAGQPTTVTITADAQEFGEAIAKYGDEWVIASMRDGLIA